MRLKTPDFWYEEKKLTARSKAFALSPLSLFYRVGFKIHQNLARPYRSSVPVLCIGNLVAGGSGKTPAVLALLNLINGKRLFEKPVCLSRGYGGSEKGPLLVDEKKHSAALVGDEPLLLAQKAACVIAYDRAAGARQAEKAGADLIIMDDGLQNPQLEKTLKIVVVDGTFGFGNRMQIPAGPLRQPLKPGLETIDAVILIGKDQRGIRETVPEHVPVFGAKIRVPESWIYNQEMPYVAFAGMGQPAKFHSTLWSKGINVIGWHTFPDHHNYSAAELEKLGAEAKKKNARLITTEKDAVRIPAGFKSEVAIDVMPVILEWEDPEGLARFLTDALKHEK